MDYQKRLRIRKILSWIYIALGIMMIGVFFLLKEDHSFLSSFGFAIFVVGIAQLRRLSRITKDPETMRKHEIAESDERIHFIAGKARSVAFSVYVVFVCIICTTLYFFEKTQIAAVLGGTVCFLIVVYWIAYFAISKKV